MKIKVTKEHIKAGQRKSARYCPVALAVTEAVGHLVYVSNEYIDCHPQHKYKKYAMPDEVANFIHNFDNNGSPEPFEFELVQVEA